MAIRFTKGYNKQIYNTVRNFNRKIKRLQEKGVSGLPGTISTKELKTNFQTRKDLNKQLKLYSRFGERSATEKVITPGGSKTSKWELGYLKSNVKGAIKFLEKEKEKSIKSNSEYRILRKDYQNNLQYKIDLLGGGLDFSSPRAFAAQKEVINAFLSNEERMIRGREKWLEIANKAAAKADIDEGIIKKLNNLMEGLDEQQFTDLFHEEGIIKRVYELKYSDDESTDPEDVKNILKDVIKKLQ